MKRILLPAFSLILICVFQVNMYAQNSAGQVSGFVVDSKTSASLPFAAVSVIHPNGLTPVQAGTTDNTGHFILNPVPYGSYYLKITFIGFDTLKSEVFTLNDAKPEKNFGNIKLKPAMYVLKEATVQEKQVRVEQKEDTIQYNSNAYKTHPDATAEELVTKMPGISTDNGGNVTAHGEQVKQVLVDGKPFFGDDPSMALKNMPADVVDKIQVFDQLSDQSQLTGIDDGNSTKTMNIVTRQGRNNGEFGKIYAGYGTDDRYIGGGNFNYFKGNTRFSIIGLANNINQQNFSSQDLLGLSGGGGSSGRGGPGGSGGYSGNFGPGGFGGGQSFLVGPQQGISATNSVGINYSDNWGKKIKISASYFFNNSINNNSTALTRNYITSNEKGLIYDENDTSKSTNYNHRFNLRFEYQVDTFNKIIITSRFNYQQNDASSSVWGSNNLPENIVESKTDNSSKADNSGYNTTNNILWQHKFRKRGRTFSINLEGDANDKTGTGSLYSLSQYISDTTLVNDHSNSSTNGYTVSSSIIYTEPLDSSSILQFNYSPSYKFNNTDKETHNFDIPNQDYSLLDTVLSNKYKNTYVSNRGGISYRLAKKKFNFMAGVNFQYATLSGDETFPTAYTVNKSFRDILPQVMLNYKFSKGTNLRIMYRTSNTVPSISQLQSVVNNTNPLLLSTGNPNLKQDYEQTLLIRYGSTKADKGTGFFVFAYCNWAMNYVGNSTFIATKDTLLNNAVILKKGSQLTNPVNLNGYWNARSFITYAFPITKIKCNLNINAGLNYNRIPALINNETNLADNYNFSGGTGLSSNISEKIDFNISYTANYSIVKNTLQTQSNSNYFYHTGSVKLNWIIWKGFFVNSSLINTLYEGLSQKYNQDYSLWNAGLGYKFLKNQSLEVKISVFDILNQNKSISRNVTDTYIEDDQTKVLNRYYMLTVTFTLKNYKNHYRPNFDRSDRPPMDRPEHDPRD